MSNKAVVHLYRVANALFCVVSPIGAGKWMVSRHDGSVVATGDVASCMRAMCDIAMDAVGSSQATVEPDVVWGHGPTGAVKSWDCSYGTREEALRAGIQGHGKSFAFGFSVGAVTTARASELAPDGESVAEFICDAMCNFAEFEGFCEPGEWSPDVTSEASAELCRIVRRWVDRHIERPSFWVPIGEPEWIEVKSGGVA